MNKFQDRWNRFTWNRLLWGCKNGRLEGGGGRAPQRATKVKTFNIRPNWEKRKYLKS